MRRAKSLIATLAVITPFFLYAPASLATYPSSPSAPTSITVAPGPGALTVIWEAPLELGGSTVTSYQVEYSLLGTSGNWSIASSNISSSDRSYIITGLSDSAQYFVRVAAKYSGGLGAFGYPWREIYYTNSPNRNSSSQIVYTRNTSANNVSTNFSRIRYRMEITYDGAEQFVEADFYKTLGSTGDVTESFNSIAKLQVPSLAPASSKFNIHGDISDLTVLSNQESVQSGSGFSGRLELWPYNYGVAPSNGLSSRTPMTYDDSDSPSTGADYGSFQLHNLTSDIKQTVFAWNRHNYDAASNSYELGFGNDTSADGHSDWTFCRTRSSCNDRTNFGLQIFINAPTQPNTATPTISSLSVNSGYTTGGTSTIISGTNLTGTSSVTIGGVNATIGTVTATSVVITTPAGLAGSRNVVLTTPKGAITSTGAYTYIKYANSLAFSTTSYDLAYSETTTVTASGALGTGAISYSEGASDACEVDSQSGVVTVTGATGTCIITASVASDENYEAANSSNSVTISVRTGATSVEITFDAGNLIYRTQKNITAVASVAGRVTFKINSKRIPGCVNKRVNEGNLLTTVCAFKPSHRGYIRISITLNPTNSAYIGSITESTRVFVGRRTGKR